MSVAWVVVGGCSVMFPDTNIGACFPTDYTMTKCTRNNTEGQDRCGGHILVVDDEKAIRGLTKRILNLNGYRVTTCGGGAKAVDVYSGLHDEIDLVILDMIMPTMNGVETLRQLQQISPTVRAVLCSAFIPDLKGHTIADEGFVGFIAKPFGIDDLLTIVDRHMK